jgi:membrane-bound serine protease (ClpP class)
MIGMYGLLFEFLNPGAIAPGVIGGICLLVALAALSVLPVNYAGLALILFGFALMAAEAFMPGFGVAGLGGIAAFVVGALFLFDPEQSDIPITVSWQIVAGLALVSAAFFAGVLGAATRVRHRPVRTGAEHLIGQTGKVVSWNEGAGFVHVDGERWEAQSRQPLSKGQAVRVIGRTGLVLIVEAQS